MGRPGTSGKKRPTAAMMAGLAGHVWSVDELFETVLKPATQNVGHYPIVYAYFVGIFKARQSISVRHIEIPPLRIYLHRNKVRLVSIFSTPRFARGRTVCSTSLVRRFATTHSSAAIPIMAMEQAAASFR